MEIKWNKQMEIISKIIALVTSFFILRSLFFNKDIAGLNPILLGILLLFFSVRELDKYKSEKTRYNLSIVIIEVFGSIANIGFGIYEIYLYLYL